MRERKLAVKRTKCDFLRGKLLFLGHVVQGSGVSPDPAKVEAIRNLPHLLTLASYVHSLAAATSMNVSSWGMLRSQRH